MKSKKKLGIESGREKKAGFLDHLPLELGTSGSGAFNPFQIRMKIIHTTRKRV
jgi:hypothetical protein